MLGSMVVFLGLSALNYYFLACSIFGLFLFLEIGFVVLLYLIIQFFRMPRGEWFLVEAHTEGAGNGHALAQSVFADRDGVYAKGTQTIFVAPWASR